MSTTINVIGTVATKPKLLQSAAGVPLCSFRLASDERRYDRETQQWVEGNTNWFSVVCFRGMSTHAHESFRVGDRVVVSGRLKIRDWERGDNKGTSVEIEADGIGHDVRWGVSRFEKRVGGQSRQDSTNAAVSGADAQRTDASANAAELPAAASQSEPGRTEAWHAAGAEQPTGAPGAMSSDGFTPSVAA